MSESIAQFVRDVPTDEPLTTTINDAKAATFVTFREHAVLRLEGGRRVLIRGGPYAIDLEQTRSNDPLGRKPDRLMLQISNRWFAVERLELHVHPKPTGPSDSDRAVIALLHQENSLLIEINGPPKGTIFTSRKEVISHDR